jgi:hypothetical protein
MIQKLKLLIFSLSSVFLFAAPLAASVAVPVTVSAQCQGNDCIQGGLCHGVQDFNVTTGTATCQEANPNRVSDLVKEIINILSVIVGIVAVIMIIIGGFRYITSGGSSEKVTAAKNTILYAIIGLVIVALSQVIVRFVLTKTTTP